MDSIAFEISQITNIDLNKVNKTLSLLLNEYSVPFIARYRKEVTGNLDEVQIREIRDQYDHLYLLNERKNTILKSISEQGKLTAELETKIKSTKSRSDLEDIYLPFKPKKRTRGQMACERGLEKIALEIINQNPETNLVQLFEQAVDTHADLKTLELVIQGVKDYIAEHISEIPDIRSHLRKWVLENATLKSTATEKSKDVKTKYNNYYEFSESLKTITPHRIMAVRRGEKEEILKLAFVYDESVPLQFISENFIKLNANEEMKNFLSECISDAFHRILSPHLETEMRLETKAFAEAEAIRVFEKNLKHLLLLPPIPKRSVMGIDPGFRTGNKVVVVDKTGKLLEHTTIHLDLDQKHESKKNNQTNANETEFSLKNKQAAETILNLIRKHGLSLISIGNGTGGREAEEFVEHVLAQNSDLTVRVVVVNEAGASVYSASDVAREEFPNLDVTVRGAISIARRLQDPLSELVKIDPKSLGIGQYQHDVNQNKLKKQLSEVVESCVNYVGVNLNTASSHLLSFVAGLGPHLSKTIVSYRNEHGEFKQRTDLLNIPGFGPKTFEQAAGFLKIPGGENPLDNTAVHPEIYEFVTKMAEELALSLKDMLGNKENIAKIKPENFVREQIGLSTVQDVLRELQKPGRDPREDGSRHSYNREIRKFEQLEEGQILTGTVTNVANFGAFVDIGVHQDGLIHVSELAHQFVSEIGKVIGVGDTVQVKIIALDKERKRISLSKKACEEKPAVVERSATASKASAHEPRRNESRPAHEHAKRHDSRPAYDHKRNETRPAHNAKRNESTKSSGQGQRTSAQESQSTKTVTLADLLNKYNSNRV